jgi:hypothetical protein
MQRKYSISCVIMLAVCFVSTANAQIPTGEIKVNQRQRNKAVVQPGVYSITTPVELRSYMDAYATLYGGS